MGETDVGPDSQGNVPGNNGSGEDGTCLSAWYKALCNVSYYSEINSTLT